VSAALFAGNAAVVKVSEFALGSKDDFEEIFRKVLANRGYNPDLVTLLAGEGDTGAALVRSGVDKILFIGSPETGKKVMNGAAEKLTPVILELGGKDPFIVLDDAELDQAAEIAVRGVFVNCGQNCIAAERLYVHERVFDRFEAKVVAKVRALRQGPSISGGCFDCGSMTMPRQVEIVEELVKDAVNRGAKVLAGGERNSEHPEGLFYKPTVLSNVDHSMDIVKKEAFGPVMLLIKFSTDKEVIEMANDSEYALGCSIFSTNYQRAEAIAKCIVSGMVTVNDFGVGYLIQSLPFGGTKMSGFGRFNGPEGLREFSRIKSVVTDRFPIRTKPPRFTSYPVPENASAVVGSAIHVFYSGEGILVKLKHLFLLIKGIATMK